jgi:hypothetical protein
MGYSAGKGDYTNIGTGNTFIGYQAGRLFYDGTDNIAIGRNSMNGIVNGANQNVCVGGSTGLALTTGDDNTFLGHETGYLVTTGSRNTIIGKGSSGNATGNDNTIVGVGIMNLGTNNNTIMGSAQDAGGFNSLLMLGVADIATANGQARFGSVASPVGSINAGAATSTQAWRVFINGIQRDIMLR